MADKRFKVALSFPGEHRAFIEEVAKHLALEYGKPHVLYDKYHTPEFARPNLDIYLPDLYKNEAELVVYFLCKDYAHKEWCGLEWRVIREMIKQGKDNMLMQFKFDNFPVPGDLSIDGYIEVNKLTHDDVSKEIIERVRRNEVALAKLNNLDSSTGMTRLQNIETTLFELNANLKNNANPETEKQIASLTAEKEELRKLLLQKEDIIAQQENTRKDLEKSLAAEQGKEELKKQALIAVEEKNYDKAEELLKEAAHERMQKVAEDFYQLGNIKELKLEYREALNYYELAAKIPPENAYYLSKAGSLCGILGLLDRAQYYFETALNIDLNKFGEENENVATYYNEIGIIWRNKGDLDKAIDYYQKSFNIDLKLFGEEHPNIATDLNNLGLAWTDKGDFDKGIDHFQKALKIDLKLFGEEYPEIATIYNNLGFTWYYKGDLDKAIDYLQRALKIDLKLSGEEHPHTSVDYNNLGSVWQNKGDFDKSVDYFQKALKIGLKLFGDEHPSIATRYNNLGRAWNAKGDLNKAIEFGEKSYSIFLKLYGADNPSTKTVKENLDGYLSKQKK